MNRMFEFNASQPNGPTDYLTQSPPSKPIQNNNGNIGQYMPMYVIKVVPIPLYK